MPFFANLTFPLYLSLFDNSIFLRKADINFTDAKINNWKLSSAAISYVYIHAYYNHRYTEVSPSKLKLKKNATRSPWLLFNLCFCLICFPYIYDHILTIFPGDPDLHFPCMLSPTPKHYCSCVQQRERKISDPPAGTKGLCDKPLLLPATVMHLCIVTLPETGKDTR